MTRRDDLPDTSGVIEDLKNEDGSIDARNLLTGGPGQRSPIGPRGCYRVRVALRHGSSVMTHASASEYGPDAFLAHARGECSCRGVSASPLAHDWHIDPDYRPGETTSATRLTPSECRRVRAGVLAGGDLKAVAADVGLHHDCAQVHANGRCNHDAAEVGHPPIRHGWHVVEDTPDSKVAADD